MKDRGLTVVVVAGMVVSGAADEDGEDADESPDDSAEGDAAGRALS
jgi:hypothetical protein